MTTIPTAATIAGLRMPNPIGPPVYMCPRCRRFFPWCQGAASEDNPEFCDDCWADAADAREGATAP